jgi:hypothetical protein
VKCALFENNHEERLIVLGASLWFEGGTFWRLHGSNTNSLRIMLECNQVDHWHSTRVPPVCFDQPAYTLQTSSPAPVAARSEECRPCSLGSWDRVFESYLRHGCVSQCIYYHPSLTTLSSQLCNIVTQKAS